MLQYALLATACMALTSSVLMKLFQHWNWRGKKEYKVLHIHFNTVQYMFCCAVLWINCHQQNSALLYSIFLKAWVTTLHTDITLSFVHALWLQSQYLRECFCTDLVVLFWSRWLNYAWALFSAFAPWVKVRTDCIQ